MEQLPLKDMVDHQQWLIENGLFTDLAKDNLYLYGSLVHKDIQALHVIIEPDTKTIKYNLYAPTDLLRKVELSHKLRNSTSVWDLWRFKRLFKKEGNLSFQPLLNKFVKDFCGPKWKAEVTLKNVSEYVDGLEDEKRLDIDKVPDRQPD